MKAKAYFTGRLSLKLRLFAILPAALLLLWSERSSAQPAPPRIGYVYPAGGQQGATFQVKVGGQRLDGVVRGYVSGEDVRVTVQEHIKPVSQGQFNKLRETLKELRDKKSPRGEPSKEDEPQIAEIKKQMAIYARQSGNPAIAETVTLSIHIADHAALGDRELRLETPQGLSNPLLFQVGALPEFVKPEPPPLDEASALARLRNREAEKAVSASEAKVSVPTVINGQILPGGRDRFRFPAGRGQNLIISVNARKLIPYLPDAVPGWFQATLGLYDAHGKQLAYADDFRFHPDPVLAAAIPADGEYFIEVRDAIYRGREDFVYRITVAESPFITGVFPAGGQVGTSPEVALTGWNLPVNRVTPPTATPGLTTLSVGQEKLISNLVPFAVDTWPETNEHEPNNTTAQARKIAWPVTINGRIQQPGDRDMFKIEGRAGERLVAEVLARRINSALDSVLTLTDAAGRPIAFNDDHEDKGAGLTTHHADSALSATLPADGIYFVSMADTQQQGGNDFVYRLRISPPQPDFALRIVPSSINVRAGGSVSLTAYALRKDGCTNEISLALKNPPPGFVLNGARVPSGQEQIRFTLTAPLSSTSGPIHLSWEGRAVIDGQTVTRPAVPAEDMMQAFAYRHLVPAQECRLLVSGRSPGKRTVKIRNELPLQLPRHGQTTLRLDSWVRPGDERFQFRLQEKPEGLAIEKSSLRADGAEIILRSEGVKTQATQGNLIIEVFAEKAGGGAGKPGAGKTTPLGILPAIPFEMARE